MVEITLFTAKKYLGLIALGLGVGTFSTLIGTGGGFVLVPILLLLYPHESPAVIASISLAVVFFNSLSGTEAYVRMGLVDYKSGLLLGLATIPGAILGVLTTSYMPRRLFDAVFGVIMIALTVYLLLWKDLDIKTPQNHTGMRFACRLVEADGTVHVYSFNPFLGVTMITLVALISGLLGIGGGILRVPVLVYLLHFPVHIGVATALFVEVIMAFSATLTHIITGTFHHGVHRTVSLAIGVMLGAQLGAHLSQRLKGRWLIRLLALTLGLVGIRILIMVFQT